MKEYIERALAVQELEVLRQEYEMHDDCDELVARRCRDALSAVPAADVAEVRHGTHKLICSECREWSGKKSRYCPSCGAHMDKEGSNDSDRDV